MVTERTTQSELLKAIVPETATVEETLKHMNCEAAMVVDSEGRLCGLVTDGDIRRAFLAGAELQSPVTKIMTRNPLAGSLKDSYEDNLGLMLRRKIRHLPIVDAEGRPMAMELLKNHYDDKDFAKAVLMAGGKGVRLRPLTYDRPKPLLKIGEDTILDNVLEGLKSNGISDVVISINYMGEKIREHVEGKISKDVNVGFVEEDRELGTAGALSLLSPRPKTSFLVMNADLLTTLDFKAFARFHKKEGNDFSVCVRRIKKTIPYGVISLAEDKKSVESVVEKPEYGFLVNAGIYMLEPKIIDLIPQNSFFDMVSLMRKAMAAGCKVGAFPILEYWRDIGQHSEMQLAAREWEQVKSKGGLDAAPAGSAAEEEQE